MARQSKEDLKEAGRKRLEQFRQQKLKNKKAQQQNSQQNSDTAVNEKNGIKVGNDVQKQQEQQDWFNKHYLNNALTPEQSKSSLHNSEQTFKTTVSFPEQSQQNVVQQQQVQQQYKQQQQEQEYEQQQLQQQQQEQQFQQIKYDDQLQNADKVAVQINSQHQQNIDQNDQQNNHYNQNSQKQQISFEQTSVNQQHRNSLENKSSLNQASSVKPPTYPFRQSPESLKATDKLPSPQVQLESQQKPIFQQNSYYDPKLLSNQYKSNDGVNKLSRNTSSLYETPYQITEYSSKMESAQESVGTYDKLTSSQGNVTQQSQGGITQQSSQMLGEAPTSFQYTVSRSSLDINNYDQDTNNFFDQHVVYQDQVDEQDQQKIQFDNLEPNNQIQKELNRSNQYQQQYTDIQQSDNNGDNQNYQINDQKQKNVTQEYQENQLAYVGTQQSELQQGQQDKLFLAQGFGQVSAEEQQIKLNELTQLEKQLDFYNVSQNKIQAKNNQQTDFKDKNQITQDNSQSKSQQFTSYYNHPYNNSIFNNDEQNNQNINKASHDYLSGTQQYSNQVPYMIQNQQSNYYNSEYGNNDFYQEESIKQSPEKHQTDAVIQDISDIIEGRQPRSKTPIQQSFNDTINNDQNISNSPSHNTQSQRNNSEPNSPQILTNQHTIKGSLSELSQKSPTSISKSNFSQAINQDTSNVLSPQSSQIKNLERPSLNRESYNLNRQSQNIHRDSQYQIQMSPSNLDSDYQIDGMPSSAKKDHQITSQSYYEDYDSSYQEKGLFSRTEKDLLKGILGDDLKNIRTFRSVIKQQSSSLHASPQKQKQNFDFVNSDHIDQSSQSHKYPSSKSQNNVYDPATFQNGDASHVISTLYRRADSQLNGFNSNKNDVQSGAVTYERFKVLQKYIEQLESDNFNLRRGLEKQFDVTQKLEFENQQIEEKYNLQAGSIEALQNQNKQLQTVVEAQEKRHLDDLKLVDYKVQAQKAELQLESIQEDILNYEYINKKQKTDIQKLRIHQSEMAPFIDWGSYYKSSQVTSKDTLEKEQEFTNDQSTQCNLLTSQAQDPSKLQSQITQTDLQFQQLQDILPTDQDQDNDRLTTHDRTIKVLDNFLSAQGDFKSIFEKTRGDELYNKYIKTEFKKDVVQQESLRQYLPQTFYTTGLPNFSSELHSTLIEFQDSIQQQGLELQAKVVNRDRTIQLTQNEINQLKIVNQDLMNKYDKLQRQIQSMVDNKILKRFGIDQYALHSQQG